MLGLREIAALNNQFIKQYTPLLPTKPLPKTNLILVVNTHDKGKMFKGKTGPLLSDPNAVRGWTYDEATLAVEEAVRLQDYFGLDTKVSVDKV